MARKKPKRKLVSRRPSAREEKSPGYMIQIPEPALVRRDVLESLREVIIFMQSYEKFKRVQEEKTKLFSELKTDLKQLNSLLTTKLKFYFPQGKLIAITKTLSEDESHDLEEVDTPHSMQEKPAAKSSVKHSTLDKLESQLQDIESQLQSIN